jgi:glutathione S-transferase
MNLYYAPGACSQAPHIVASEAGIALDLEHVDIMKTPHMTASGRDYATINPKLYVPALELDDGEILTEVTAIVQLLADVKPESGLIPPAGTRERTRVISWLGFVATELHKTYSPWLFHADCGTIAQDVARARIAKRLAHVERHLAEGGPYLTGETFTVADAYLFTIVGWSAFTKVDLAPFPALRAYMERVGARPAVRAAIDVERRRIAA